MAIMSYVRGDEDLWSGKWEPVWPDRWHRVLFDSILNTFQAPPEPPGLHPTLIIGVHVAVSENVISFFHSFI